VPTPVAVVFVLGVQHTLAGDGDHRLELVSRCMVPLAVTTRPAGSSVRVQSCSDVQKAQRLMLAGAGAGGHPEPRPVCPPSR